MRQEVFLKLHECLDEIENPSSWIARVTKNQGLDYLKGIKNERDKRHLIYVLDMDENEFNQPELQYIEREFKMLSEIEKLKTIKPQFLKGLERSLNYIRWVYYLKEQYDYKQESVLPFVKMRTVLVETKNEIEDIFGPPSEKEVMKTYRTLIRPRLSKEDKSHFDMIFRQPIHYLEKLQLLRAPFTRDHKERMDEVEEKYGWSPKKMLEATSFPEELDRLIDQLFFWDRQKEFYNLSCQYLSELIKKMDEKIQGISSLEWDLLPYEFKNLLGNIDKLNIDPPALIFRVWIRAFKKGKKTNLKLVKNLLLEFKKTSKKMVYNPLFEDLDESLNAETWRKKIYKPSANKEFYEELSDLIYKKSFFQGGN